MMKTKLLLLVFSLAMITGNSYAQKIKVDGDLKFLKDVKALELAYSYDHMSVGKYDNEEDYLNERAAKRNEKEPGAGDKWKEDWVNDREERFEPKFEELFNEYIAEKGMKAGKEMDDAPVKLLIHTTFTEPGFNVGVMRKPAYINAELIYIDKKSGETLATMEITKVPGRDAMGYDFDTGYRLQEAYAKLGKETGKYIIKKAL